MYKAQEIEAKWQAYWQKNDTYKVENESDKPKFYVLDMFPYPSGAGLHVGHPLGYIASDIYARYKRMQGYNVLHPMGFDSFGLPAEQYAIQTGVHPATTTAENIARYTSQLRRIGFSYDWSREVRTSQPDFYHWTQWIFMQIFDSWYNQNTQKAEPIAQLIQAFETSGNHAINASCEAVEPFSAQDWQAYSPQEKATLLLKYRLAYLSETSVNWCSALGMVLSNDEVKDGVSERGAHPVEQRKMWQWSMRISAYAQRLLDGLHDLDWSDSLKEMQRNWIGRSQGAYIHFGLNAENTQANEHINVFTTRPDTVFGVGFLVLAPEHELVEKITTQEHKVAVNEYINQTKKRSERDRQATVKQVSGQFTGAYATHPFTQKNIPIYIADYVLSGYGTGAVMAVPSGDQRDYAFAKHFGLPILPILDAQTNLETQADATKEGKYINSDFINGLEYKAANEAVISALTAQNKGQGTINYRLRDAIFARQRYWGEPMPVYFEQNIAKLIAPQDLPLILPKVDKYLPTQTGEPPLARAENWNYHSHPLETNTMPGWAGSSWYYLRYMDPQNAQTFASRHATDYWQSVDLYIGGTEHATGHLLYARFWCMFLYDGGHIGFQEPFKKLVNQGMILGDSRFAHRIKDTNTYVSSGLKNQYETTKTHVDVNMVNGYELDIQDFKAWRKENENAEFILENGKFLCSSEVEKMSKSKYNVVSPDKICDDYGADTLRLYEMFLGPLQDAKPWDLKGIEGVKRFLNKLWRLFYDDNQQLITTNETPTEAELKVLHTLIKKIGEDIENLSYNTSVSAFMICTNELSDLKCHKTAVLSQVVLCLAPFAPHLCEELWQVALSQQSTVTEQFFPSFNAEFLVEKNIDYPITVNGKLKRKMTLPADLTTAELEKAVMENPEITALLEGKTVKKLILVPNKIINFVV